MPIFEFRCGECRRKFEKIVLSGGAPATAECPKCGRKGAERQVSRFATAAKASGDDWGGDFGGDDGDDGGDFGGGGMDDDAGGGFGGGDVGDFGGEEGGWHHDRRLSGCFHSARRRKRVAARSA
jgi:putative FmdB family regulatory protein